MKKILAIDLGKFKSVTCLLNTETNQTEFWTMTTDRRASAHFWVSQAVQEGLAR